MGHLEWYKRPEAPPTLAILARRRLGLILIRIARWIGGYVDRPCWGVPDATKARHCVALFVGGVKDGELGVLGILVPPDDMPQNLIIPYFRALVEAGDDAPSGPPGVRQIQYVRRPERVEYASHVIQVYELAGDKARPQDGVLRRLFGTVLAEAGDRR